MMKIKFDSDSYANKIAQSLTLLEFPHSEPKLYLHTWLVGGWIFRTNAKAPTLAELKTKRYKVLTQL